MRLLHISDFHAREDRRYDADVVLSRFFADIAQEHADQAFTHLAFTGDLTFSAAPAQFELAREQLIDRLLKITGLCDDDLFIVPGNHDVDRELIEGFAEKGLRTISKRDEVNSVIGNPVLLEQHAARVMRGVKFCGQFGRKSLELETTLGATHRLFSGGRTVTITRLNSAWRASGDEDDGEHRYLLVGERELRTHAESVADADLSIVLLHHPLEWLAEFDRSDAKPMIEKTFDLVLTGHTHEDEPSSRTTPDGRTSYSQAGSLFESRTHPNSYTIIDVDLVASTGKLSVRKLDTEPESSFEHAHSIEVEFGSQLSLDGISPRPQHNDILDHLANRVRASSIVGDQLRDLENAKLGELLIRPVILPVPYDHWARSRRPGSKVESVRIESEIPRVEGATVILSGRRESGLSSSLIWLIFQSYLREPNRLPLFVRFSEIGTGNQAVAKAVEAAKARAGFGSFKGQMAIAFDDVVPTMTKACERLANFISMNPNSCYFIGCAESDEIEVEEHLEAVDVATERAFLAPFGSQELRSLVRRISPEADPDVVDRIMQLLHSENLPRTPFLMAAMIYVVSADASAVELHSESALLDRYIRLLLGSANLAEDPRLVLDETDRDRLLAALAERLFRDSVDTLSVQDCERFLLDYFARAGWKDYSAGDVLKGLTARRVLYSADGAVRFRHESFLYLFVAKQMNYEPAFYEYVLSSPLEAVQPARYLASIQRNNRDLLQRAADVFESEFAELERELKVAYYDHVRVVPGFSNSTDVKQLAAANSIQRIRGREEREEDDDRSWQELEARKQAHREGTAIGAAEHHPGERLTEAIELFSAVLRSSDHILDVELKTALLQRVLTGWSWMYVALAVTEDHTGHAKGMTIDLFERLRDSFDRENPDHIRHVDSVVQIILAGAISGAIEHALATRKLHVPLSRLLDSEVFMSMPAPALLATLLYADLRLPNWPDRLARLLHEHGDHSVVREVIRYYARFYYFELKLPEVQSDVLEATVVNATLASSGFATDSGQARARASDNVREALRRDRTVARMKSLGSGRGETGDHLSPTEPD